MRTFARKKKGSPPHGTDAITGAARVVSGVVPANVPGPAPSAKQRKGQAVGHPAAHSAQPDPYAFDIFDDDDAPGEGSQHDPAFLGSLVARLNSSQSDDGRLNSASPPEHKTGRGPSNMRGAWALGRCVRSSSLLTLLCNLPLRMECWDICKQQETQRSRPGVLRQGAARDECAAASSSFAQLCRNAWMVLCRAGHQAQPWQLHRTVQTSAWKHHSPVTRLLMQCRPLLPESSRSRG